MNWEEAKRACANVWEVRMHAPPGVSNRMLGSNLTVLICADTLGEAVSTAMKVIPGATCQAANHAGPRLVMGSLPNCPGPDGKATP